jgi:3-oxoacyl-[acyl-carrier-protein] synthase-3
MMNLRILGGGRFLPENVVHSTELDRRYGKPEGWAEKKSGVGTRYYATDTSASKMGAMAIQEALRQSNLQLSDIDCIIAASGTMVQPLPYNAAGLFHELSAEEGSIVTFDVNSTCLSFVTALHLASQMIATGTYNKIAIVSSEAGSVGLAPDDLDTALLFGDGAVAYIVGAAEPNQRGIFAHQMKTYKRGFEFCKIPGGGTWVHPNSINGFRESDLFFSMEGKKMMHLAFKELPKFVDELMDKAGLLKGEINYVVPHQASKIAVPVLTKLLGFDGTKVANTLRDYGNQIAASIPNALYVSIQNGSIQRGDTVMLLGTSAGLSIGGLIFQY